VSGAGGSLGLTLRAWPTLWRVAVADIVAYRAEMVIWILSATLPLVMLSLWSAASAGGPLSGFGEADFARYFAVTLVVRQLTGSWVVWELNYQIRTGSLSPALLKPLNPLWYNFASTLAAIPWRLVVLTPILLGVWWWKPEILFLPTLVGGLGFLVSVTLALILSWLVQVMFGLAAFWFDQSLGLFSVYFAVWAFFSGYFVPLPLLPPWLSVVTRWLPFHGTLGAPIGILTGTITDVAATIGLQLAWVVALSLASMATWRAGLSRYGAVGA